MRHAQIDPKAKRTGITVRVTFDQLQRAKRWLVRRIIRWLS